MIGTILQTLFNEWMLLRSNKFAKFIFSIEGYGFLIIAVFVYFIIPDASLIVLIPMVVLWGAFNIQQYFYWQKKRAEANKEDWNPNDIAKIALLIVSAGSIAMGIFCIIFFDFKLEIVPIVIALGGIGCIGFGVGNFIQLFKKGFNSIEY